MEIVNSRARQVLDGIGDHARTETGWLIFHMALTGAVVWLAVHGIDPVPPALWWALAGAIGGDTLNSARSTVAAWREYRRLHRCIRCVGLVADQDEAYQLGRRCARRGHMQADPGPAGPGQVTR